MSDSAIVQFTQIMTRLGTEGANALAANDHKKAAKVFEEFRSVFAELAKNPEAPTTGIPFEAYVHLTTAKRDWSLYQIGIEEGDAPSALENRIGSVIRDAQLAFDQFDHEPYGAQREQARELTMKAHQALAILRGQRGDLQGMQDALQAVEQHLTEFRRETSKEEFEKNLPLLKLAKSTTALNEGLHSLFLEMNPQAAQKGFKSAEHLLEDALTMIKDAEVVSTVKSLQQLYRALSEFGEGFVLNAQGSYYEAAERMQRAESLSRQAKANLAFPLEKASAAWGRLYLGTANELDGKYQAAIREYRSAQVAFREAIELTPTNLPLTAMIGSQMRFYSDAAQHRIAKAQARASEYKRRAGRGKLLLGALFFLFWAAWFILVIGGIRFLSLNPDTTWLLLIIIIISPLAAVSAALLRIEDALAFLKDVASAIRGATNSQEG